MNEVSCPVCHKKGEVRARKDAYINYKLKIVGKSVDWIEEDTAEMDDVRYECFSCGEEFEEGDLLKENNLNCL